MHRHNSSSIAPNNFDPDAPYDRWATIPGITKTVSVTPENSKAAAAINALFQKERAEEGVNASNSANNTDDTLNTAESFPGGASKKPHKNGI